MKEAAAIDRIPTEKEHYLRRGAHTIQMKPLLRLQILNFETSIHIDREMRIELKVSYLI